MAARTPNVYAEKLKSGKTVYRAMLTFRDQATGARKQKMVTYPTKKEAQDALAANRAEAMRGNDAPPAKTTVGDLLTEWLARKQGNVKPLTFLAYHNTVERHLRPDLGGLRVGALTERRVEQHYSTLRQRGVGPQALRTTHRRLREIMLYARRQRLVLVNPMDNVETPVRAGQRMRVWNDDEIGRFIAVADQSAYGPLWIVAMHTGMRRSELLGLRWCDVDAEAGVIHARQQALQYGGHNNFVSTKGGRERAISVDGSVFAALRQHRKTQMAQRLRAGEHWHEHDLVFTSSYGGAISPPRLRLDFKRLVGLAGVPDICIHEVRHSHGSWLIRNGKSVKEVAERLGHQRASVTLDTYTHALPNEHRQTAQDIARWLANG